MNRKNVIALLLGLVFLLGAAVNVAAQINPGEHAAPSSPAAPKSTPGMILTYQGRLTDKNGVPINSTVSIVFKVYDFENQPVALWTSNPRTITPTNGLFTVYLGDSNDATPLPIIPYPQYASISINVNGDGEMTQPLNSVIGYSANGPGVSGYGTNVTGVVGNSLSGTGVEGVTMSLDQPGVMALNLNPGSPALKILGGIQVGNAGVDTNTPVFMHRVVVDGTGANVCAPYGLIKYATIIDNPYTNGDPNAILIVTPNYRKSDYSQSASAGPAKDIPAVFYSVSGGCSNIGKWVIYNLNSTAMVDNTFYNVMVIKP